jgi:acetyl-CoA synthetase
MSRYKINNLEEYFKEYKKSVREPRKFWDKIASENFTWYQEWEKVVDFNMEANIKWFVDAKVNITKIVLTDTLPKKRQNRNHFEPNDPSEEALHISYTELHQRVCKMANVLQEQGVEGDRVCIYLPMIPELAIATLACARIGAIHSVVFAGFSASAVATRINDSEWVITSDGGYRGNKTIDLKGIIDDALVNTPCVANVLVVKERTAPST